MCCRSVLHQHFCKETKPRPDVQPNTMETAYVYNKRVVWS